MNHPLINWIQIPVIDLDRAAAFYSKVFGVEFFFEELNGMPHAVFQADSSGERPVNGALVKLPEAEIGNAGPVLFWDATGRFEHILDQIEPSGGTVVRGKTLIKLVRDGDPTVIPATYIDDNPGYFAHFIDSEGNRMGLYGSH